MEREGHNIHHTHRSVTESIKVSIFSFPTTHRVSVIALLHTYRNEISPRAGLLRVREFEMAEIEHFVNPEKRQTFAKFDQVADLQISFYSACNQMEGKPPQLLRLGDAVKSVSCMMQDSL